MTLIVLGLILVSLVIVLVYAFQRINMDVVSEVEILNPAGDKGRALVIYHPGLSDFQYKVTIAFAEGLVSNGWRVEVTTASSSAPTNLSGYDLLVLGSPTYGGKPAPSIERYLTRVGNLELKRTVIIATAGGSNLTAERMKELVQTANGSVAKSITLFTMAPNDGDPIEIATNAGKEIATP